MAIRAVCQALRAVWRHIKGHNCFIDSVKNSSSVHTAALMSQVLKHLALFSFHCLMQLALPRLGVREKQLRATLMGNGNEAGFPISFGIFWRLRFHVKRHLMPTRNIGDMSIEDKFRAIISKKYKL